MGQDQRTESTTVTESGDPEQIREQIEATREDLGDTVAALSQKADVKAQAKQKIDATKASVSEKKEQLLGKAPDGAVSAASQASQKARENPVPLAVAGAFTAGFLAGRVFRR